MHSSDNLQECRPCDQVPQRSAHQLVSGERPVLQALWCMILRGAQIVSGAVRRSDLKDEGVEPPSDSLEDFEKTFHSCYEDSVAEGMFHTCYERIEDISWGEEKQQSDTKLRSSTPIRNVYLPESGLDAHISFKLRAVRQAFQIIICDPESRNFLKEAGLNILTGLLSLAGKKTEGFTLVWNNLTAFAESPSNWATIAKECQEAGMQTPCFYDLFYEAIVLKLLECSEQVPPVLKTTLRTPWISNNMKKTTVMFHAWAQIRKDREQLMGPLGLYQHLCEVRDYIDPEVMWAAFGPQSDTKDFYLLFKGEMLSFILHIFSLDRQSYSSPSMLAVLVFSAWRGLVCRLLEYLMDQQRAQRCQAPRNITNSTPGPPTSSPQDNPTRTP